MSRLNGKVALITGASRGIGAALAKGMADQGAKPAEVGSLVVFLASDESSFSTGSEFILDGGQTAGITLFAWQKEQAAA